MLVLFAYANTSTTWLKDNRPVVGRRRANHPVTLISFRTAMTNPRFAHLTFLPAVAQGFATVDMSS